MRIGIYPGSFDPLTNGHMDIIERAVEICDKLIISVATNIAKTALFSAQERVEIINNCCKHINNLEVTSFDGLLVDYCHEKNASMIIRGLRTNMDFEYEKSIATVNRKLAPNIETVFLMTKGEYYFISSHLVKEIASFSGDLTSLVPRFAQQKLQQKFPN